jgi:membrane-anchored glycerophosphoryl diester phosphodiesterase (GDPDase)
MSVLAANNEPWTITMMNAIHLPEFFLSDLRDHLSHALIYMSYPNPVFIITLGLIKAGHDGGLCGCQLS